MGRKLLKIIRNFNDNINSLKEFVDAVQPVLKKESFAIENISKHISTDAIGILAIMCYSQIEKIKEINQKIEQSDIERFRNSVDKYVEMNNIRVNKTNGGFELSSNKDFTPAVREINDVLSNYRGSSKRTDILYRSSLMSLVVYFESMFSEVFKYNFDKNPDSILEKKSLTFLEIKELNSLEQAVEYIIEKEIETMMYKSFEDWCQYLEKNIKLEMEYLKDEKETIVEIICRRNLFVHNEGKVNSIYLKKVSKTFTEGIAKNTVLNVNRAYIDNAISIFERTGNLILIELLMKNDKAKADYWDFTFNIAYSFLEDGNWETSAAIYSLLLKYKNVSSKDKLMAKINYWQSIKWMGKYEVVKNEVEKVDYSAYSSELQLAICALKDDCTGFFDLLPQVCPSIISYDSVKSWPIFKEMRKESNFKKFIKTVEKKPKYQLKKLPYSHNKGKVYIAKKWE